eukprot:gene7365-15037_t
MKNIIERKIGLIFCDVTIQSCQKRLEYELYRRPQSFITPYENFSELLLDGINEHQIDNVRDLAKLLSDRSCTSVHASEHLRRYLSVNMSRVVKDIWREPMVGVWRDIDVANVPCDSSYWIKGHWYVIPMHSHEMKTTSVSRCPSPVIDRSDLWNVNINDISSSNGNNCQNIRGCDMLSGVSYKCKTTWNLNCPTTINPNISKYKYTIYKSTSTQSSSSFQGEDNINSNSNDNNDINNDNDSSCLVYSFGISDSLDYELYMASKEHCEVHVFDTRSESELLEAYSDSYMMDCGGCEWEVLADLITSHPHYVQHTIDNMLLTLHMGRSTTSSSSSRPNDDVAGVRTDENEQLVEDAAAEAENNEEERAVGHRVKAMSLVFGTLLRDMGFRLWHRHVVVAGRQRHRHSQRQHEGYSCQQHEQHHVMIDLGFPSDVCSYEIGLVRIPSSFRISSKSSSSTTSMLESPTTENKKEKPAFLLNNLKVRNGNNNNNNNNNNNDISNSRDDVRMQYSDDDNVIRSYSESLDTISDVIDSSQQASINWDSYADPYNYLASSELTVAIVQHDVTIHSEMIGPVANLMNSIGFKHIIIYNDYHINSNKDIKDVSMIPYQEGWRNWDIRPSDHWMEDRHVWNITILITGDEMYRFSKELLDLYYEISHRVVLIHHHQNWILPSTKHKYLLLTRSRGNHHYFFPISKYNFSELQSINNNINYNKRTLLLMGVVKFIDKDETKNPKIKDSVDIRRFLASHTENNLIVMARKEYDFHVISHEFPHQTRGLWMLSSKQLLEVVRAYQMLWFPILKNSSYATGSFPSALGIGMSMRKTMIMPRHLSDFFGLSGVVVTYEKSITEIDLENIDHEKFRRKMDIW